MRSLLIVFGLLFVMYFAVAATYNAASSSKADIQNAIDQAVVPGDIVKIPPGTNTFDGQIDITNAITIFATNGSRFVIGGRTMLVNGTIGSSGLETPIFNIKSKADPNAKIEIYGIYFLDENIDWNSDGIDIPGSVFGGAEGGGGIFERKVIIHDCTFDSFNFGTKWDGAWGLDYSNEYYMCANSFRVKGFNTLAALPVPDPESYRWNSVNYVVFEDDLFTFVQWTAKDTYLGDSEWPANYMVRYCTMNIDRGFAQNRGVDGFDMHGETAGGDAHVPLGPVIYKTVWNYTGNNTVNPNRILDMRGGANSLLYSNVVNGDDQYVNYRDDPASPAGLTTNNWAWQNIDAGGDEFGYDNNLDGVQQGVNFFLGSEPPGFVQLAYPHPFRSPESPPPPPPSDVRHVIVGGRNILGGRTTARAP